MSKRLAGLLCLQFLIASLVGFPGALADDAPSSQPQATINDPNQPQGGQAATGPAQNVYTPDSPPSLKGDAPSAPNGTTQGSATGGKATESGGETAQPDQSKAESKPPSEPAKLTPAVEAHTSQPAAKASPVASSKKLILYGRIEQIAAGTGAQFPIVLRPMKAKMDPRAVQLKASASDAALHGTVVSSFPTDYDGTWGGTLTIWTTQQSALAWQVDPDEAKWSRAAFMPGRVGQTNFIFGRDTSKNIELEPAKILFSVPMKDTYGEEQISKMLASSGLSSQLSAPGSGDVMRQLIGNMSNSMMVPVMLALGNVQTEGTLERGVSGNQLEERVFRNVIRQLATGVLEQQIVVSTAERNAKTGELRYGYGESVVRITKLSADQLYAQVATVSYSQDRQFLNKIILYGTLRRGQVVNTTMDPMGGLGNLLNMPGVGGGQMPGMPQMRPGQSPYGNIQDLQKNFQNLQNLFPH
jgi:hypothetical protein